MLHPIQNMTTKNLFLKKPTMDDLDELFRLTSKPGVNTFNPDGADTDINETKEVLTSWMDDWNKNNIGYHIARTHNGEFIGYMGVTLRNFSNQKMLNLAYRIEPAFHRKGYVFEACSHIINELPDDYKNFPIRVLTKKENIPSINLAKKLGFIYNEKLDNYPDNGDVNLFNVPNKISDDWIK